MEMRPLRNFLRAAKDGRLIVPMRFGAFPIRTLLPKRASFAVAQLHRVDHGSVPTIGGRVFKLSRRPFEATIAPSEISRRLASQLRVSVMRMIKELMREMPFARG